MDVPVRAVGNCGRIKIGKQCSMGFQLAMMKGDGRILLQARETNAEIEIGDRAEFSNNVVVVSRTSVKIGDDFLCGDGVRIMDADFHEVDPELRHLGPGKTSPVVIGNNVWLGSGVMVLKGVTIGDHSVIAPGSVVSKSVPSGVVAGGIPARVIKEIGTCRKSNSDIERC